MGQRLTLDTMLARDLLEQRPQREATEAILELAHRGHCELAVTARIREDVPADPLASRIDELQLLAIEETGSITRLGYWVLGRDQIASDDFAAFDKEIQERRSRGEKVPDWRDLDHLHAHFQQKRDVFLTRDGPILGLAGELRQRFGIVVMRPDEYLRSRA
jgi:hypothetical protein